MEDVPPASSTVGRGLCLYLVVVVSRTDSPVSVPTPLGVYEGFCMGRLGVILFAVVVVKCVSALVDERNHFLVIVN